MKQKLTFLLLVSLLLGACAPVQVTVTLPTIAPPQIGLTVDLTPAPSATPAPVSTIPPPAAPGETDPVMMVFYGLLVVGGIALLIALFALLRRPGG